MQGNSPDVCEQLLLHRKHGELFSGNGNLQRAAFGDVVTQRSRSILKVEAQDVHLGT